MNLASGATLFIVFNPGLPARNRPQLAGRIQVPILLSLCESSAERILRSFLNGFAYGIPALTLTATIGFVSGNEFSRAVNC